MKSLFVFCAIVIAVSGAAQTNYALNLNGTNQYVSIGTPLSNNSSYTKEAWVYSTTNAGSRNIISSNAAPFWLSAGTLAAGHGGNFTQVTDPTTFPVNKWTHVAVTYDAATTTMKLYRDGTLVATNTGVASNYTSESTFIGSHAGGSSYFQGMIDEVRIWNVARTQAELKQYLLDPPANNASGLVSYHKLNDGSGSTSTNSTGGANGTLQNAPAWVASPAQPASNALSFDGTDDVVTIPDNNSLDITAAITLEAWVFATKNTGIQNVVSKSSQSINNGYIFPRTDDGWANAVVYLHIGGVWRQLSAAYPSLNAWHHLAATYDGASINIYIDGVLSGTQARTGAIASNANALALGNQPGYSEFFGGSVDEIRIWNVARTQAQIQSSMFVHLDPAAQTGLVTNYTFNQGITAGTNAGMTTIVDLKNENNGSLTNFALSGTSSNYVMQNATLPVSWVSFIAEQKSEQVALTWSTASEYNAGSFIVQHSVDATTWKNIGTVAASGNSISLMKYNFNHSTPATGLNYYRIKQVDIDGHFSFSEIRTVKVGDRTSDFVIMNNPVSGQVLSVQISRPSMLYFYNGDGKLLWQRYAAAGVLNINTASMAQGIYFIRVGGVTKKIFIR